MRRTLLAALLLLAPLAAEARDPSPEMRSRIEAALREQGYTAWDDIDVERDGRIEVDDARGADGKEYDLKLDPQTLRVIEREED
ncbi:MAG: PepSY domain-containing protein [Acetobacteraceae bacterium]|nr:PepSY domain-containing protein [Acetobacteraceae bacterium]